VLGALGVVYGDIGTSPLYAIQATFVGAHPLPVVEANILGVLSVMFWTIMLLVSLKYVVVILRADNNGEGGSMALLALVYVLGPVSACHVNPAVTLGALLARRVTLIEAAGYWAAQFVGGILGALVLWGLFNSSPYYSLSRNGLGTNGWGRSPSCTSPRGALSWPR